MTIKRWLLSVATLALFPISALAAPNSQNVMLSDLDLSVIEQGYGQPQKNRSISQAPLSIAGQKFEHGVGTHAPSAMFIDLHGADHFTANVGVDDGAGKAGTGVAFRIFADGKSLFGSGAMKLGDASKKINLDLTGFKRLELIVDPMSDSISYDHADWADAAFTYTGEAPVAVERPRVVEPAIRLTPPPAPSPRINGGKVFGVRPGSPFLFTVAATGDRPMTFAADNLPSSLKLDPSNGQITGTLDKAATYDVTLTAKNAHGEARRAFKIVCGDTLALTPPMGWNSWYIWFGRVTDKAIRDSADAMVNSGMINYGYQYVDIDDCWAIRTDLQDPRRSGEPRDAQGHIRANQEFPDMKALTDYIHAKGLKAGIYSSPGPLTCAKYTGSYEHEAQDAQQIADWGFDLFKYDWCSYGIIKPKPTTAEAREPYQKMGDLLKQQKRDILLNLCQYGRNDVWTWGEASGGQLWRTANDLGTNWRSIGPSMYRDCFDEYAKFELHKYAHPGAWNDPDYLLIGKLGLGGKVRPSTMTPNEQYQQVTFWSLVAAPIFFGGDMTQIDDFTLGLLCNSDVLDVDQDALGKAAQRVAKKGGTEIWARDLEDGSKAVGLFNRGETETDVSVAWETLGLSGERVVHDLWRESDLGLFKDKFDSKVGRHGVTFIRVK